MKSNLSNYADLLAIPFFILLVIYFYKKKNRTNIENILFLFAIAGLILDIFFSYIFLY
jgi:hypothetical protein|uniref:Uncharacterized protein n=1 Tax=viral metagenome TaxID=1070528 RepID=A0A6C0DVH9_9ZZZZ